MMGLFSKSYEPGGKHHLHITNEAFKEASSASAEELKRDFSDLAQEMGCAKYEAHDFPVTKVLGTFILAYKCQERKSGVPEDVRMANVQLGRKDQVELERFIKRYNDRIDMKIEDKVSSWNGMGLGGKLLSIAASAAAQGVAKVATGKSADMRGFEKQFLNYICGESALARECLTKYAEEFGPLDEGVLALAKAIRLLYWQAEFVRYNRGI